MGLFDYINCKYKLPLPEDVMELKEVDFNKLSYQTKDLEDLMDLYEIREDGTLWVERHEREWVEGNPKGKSICDRVGYMKSVKCWWEQCVNFNGSVNFYEHISFHEYEHIKNNYWVEYIALFTNGKVTEMKLHKFEATDNSQARKNHQEFKDKMNARKVLWDKWYMKHIYKYYDNSIDFLFKKYRKFKYFIDTKTPTSYQIEQWLRPL